MYIIEVIPCAGNPKHDTLSYFSKEIVAPGALVRIPYRKGKIYGVALSSTPLSDLKNEIKDAHYEMKKILEVKTNNFLGPSFATILEDFAQYYVSTKARVFNICIPEMLLSRFDALTLSDEIHKERTSVHEKLILQAPLADRLSWYRTHIRESFARKESVFIAAPTIHDLEILESHLSKGISEYTFVLSSELSLTKRVSVWNKIMTLSHPVLIIATPQYASLPRVDIGSLIIEHERSSAYKSINAPGFDFRIFIELLAHARKQKIIFADTLLRIETIERLHDHEVSEVMPLVYRLEHDTKINIVHVPEQKNIPQEKRYISFTPEMAELIVSRTQKEHLFIFTLKNGLANITKCKDCSTILSCEFCRAPLALFETGAKGRVFICKECKRHTPSDSPCTNCQSWNLIPLGIGIDLVLQELEKIAPGIPVFRIDSEHVTTIKEGKKIYKSFLDSPGGVLVGTERALSFMKRDIHTTIVSSFDSLFAIPSFRIGERILTIITRLLEITNKELYIQTRSQDESILPVIERGFTNEWFRSEKRDRERFLYPPFGTIIKIQSIGREDVVRKDMEYMKGLFENYHPDIFPTSIQSKRGLARMNCVVRIKRREWSLPVIHQESILSPELAQCLRRIPDTATIAVDGEDLLN